MQNKVAASLSSGMQGFARGHERRSEVQMLDGFLRLQGHLFAMLKVLDAVAQAAKVVFAHHLPRWPTVKQVLLLASQQTTQCRTWSSVCSWCSRT